MGVGDVRGIHRRSKEARACMRCRRDDRPLGSSRLGHGGARERLRPAWRTEAGPREPAGRRGHGRPRSRRSGGGGHGLLDVQGYLPPRRLGRADARLHSAGRRGAGHRAGCCRGGRRDPPGDHGLLHVRRHRLRQDGRERPGSVRGARVADVSRRHPGGRWQGEGFHWRPRSGRPLHAFLPLGARWPDRDGGEHGPSATRLSPHAAVCASPVVPHELGQPGESIHVLKDAAEGQGVLWRRIDADREAPQARDAGGCYCRESDMCPRGQGCDEGRQEAPIRNGVLHNVLPGEPHL
mmetsp:Transcript_19972/g.56345  ORF Transcript_19972/g.56345 Transcript_19972/m.56345 type:complete len:294 (-) Transcript_19972:940-1821(-)